MYWNNLITIVAAVHHHGYSFTYVLLVMDVLVAWHYGGTHCEAAFILCICSNGHGWFIRRDRIRQEEMELIPRYGHSKQCVTNSNMFHVDCWISENSWNRTSLSYWTTHHITLCISHTLGSKLETMPNRLYTFICITCDGCVSGMILWEHC